jgi:hypothetical protein
MIGGWRNCRHRWPEPFRLCRDVPREHQRPTRRLTREPNPFWGCQLRDGEPCIAVERVRGHERSREGRACAIHLVFECSGDDCIRRADLSEREQRERSASRDERDFDSAQQGDDLALRGGEAGGADELEPLGNLQPGRDDRCAVECELSRRTDLVHALQSSPSERFISNLRPPVPVCFKFPIFVTKVVHQFTFFPLTPGLAWPLVAGRE